MDGFSHLFRHLDSDVEVASERYEILRLKITRVLQWRGCPESEADALADEVFERLGAKIAGGVEIENLESYAAAVCRYVLLEFKRKHREDAYGDDLPELSFNTSYEDDDSHSERLGCLRRCLIVVAPIGADRTMLLRYYDSAGDEKNKDARRALAEEFGVTPNALRVRACRLRAKLERCVIKCVERVTELEKNATQNQEASVE